MPSGYNVRNSWIQKLSLFCLWFSFQLRLWSMIKKKIDLPKSYNECPCTTVDLYMIWVVEICGYRNAKFKTYIIEKHKKEDRRGTIFLSFMSRTSIQLHTNIKKGNMATQITPLRMPVACWLSPSQICIVSTNPEGCVYYVWLDSVIKITIACYLCLLRYETITSTFHCNAFDGSGESKEKVKEKCKVFSEKFSQHILNHFRIENLPNQSLHYNKYFVNLQSPISRSSNDDNITKFICKLFKITLDFTFFG